MMELRMRSPILAAPLALALLIVAAPAAAAGSTGGDNKALHTFADIGAIGIPIAAGIFTIVEHDHNGLIQLAETGATTLAVSEALKYGVNSERPNGGRLSFPSLHTSASFAGAGFIHARYGWRAGLPFELLALGVGIARVQTRDHHWYDVVAGAAIGEGSAYLFTRRLRDDVQISLGADSKGGIVTFASRF
jgi:membrane-associated phospholipid phosphatase